MEEVKLAFVGRKNARNHARDKLFTLSFVPAMNEVQTDGERLLTAFAFYLQVLGFVLIDKCLFVLNLLTH